MNTKTDDLHKNTNVIGTGRSYASGGGIKHIFHAVSYQIKLPMLYIIRCLKQNCEFRVGIDVEGAEKFDDILFLYEKSEIGFIQTKHRLNKNFEITEDHLLSTEGDFSIQKYYQSYNNILGYKLSNVIEDRDVVLIVNTNIGINSTVLKSFEHITASSLLSGNNILALGTDMKGCYIIKKESKLYNNIFHLLEELAQPSSRLAANLARAVVNNKKKIIKVDELFEIWREWLQANVLEVGKEDNKSQKRYYVAFKDSFLSGSGEGVSNFQKIFFNTYLAYKQIEKEDKTSVKVDLSDVKFQVPKYWAEMSLKPKMRQDIGTFLERLVFVVNQPNETTLRDIIEEEIGDYVGRAARKSITDKFQLYIQDWAVQKVGRYLTKEDAEQQFALWKDGHQENTDVIGTGPLYAGGGMKNTFHAVSYQIKLPILYIIRCLKQNCKFQVGVEVEGAEKFDDLLFSYEKSEIGFIQAKHRLNKNFEITEDHLLSTEGDFSIQKYYQSYNNILGYELRNVIEDRDVVLIVNTNIGINSTVLKSFEHITASSLLSGNNILPLGTDMKGCYIIKKGSSIYNKTFDLLEELAQPSSRLAANLAKAVVNNKKKSIKVDKLFESYREWLLANVLEVGKEDNKSQKRYYVAFKDSFLSDSGEGVSNFQKIFFNTYLAYTQTEKEDMTSVKVNLSDVKFQVPKYWTEMSLKPKMRQDIGTFLERLVFVVNQPNETTLSDIIEKEIGDYVGHAARKSITDKFQLYIQDWAVQKVGRYLTNEDVERQFALWKYEALCEIRINNIKKYRCTGVLSKKAMRR